MPIFLATGGEGSRDQSLEHVPAILEKQVSVQQKRNGNYIQIPRSEIETKYHSHQ